MSLNSLRKKTKDGLKIIKRTKKKNWVLLLPKIDSKIPEAVILFFGVENFVPSTSAIINLSVFLHE